MSNEIKLKRGSGSDPSASDLVVGELAIRTDLGKIFTKKDNGNVAEISGGGGIDDGDKGDITVSNAGDTWTIDSGVINNAKVASDAAIALSKLATGTLPSGITIARANLQNNIVKNGEVASDAAIAGSKINPAFTSGYVSAIFSANDTDFSDNSAPAATHGFFTNNSQSTNGVFSAFTATANNASGTNQAASFIAQSVSGGTCPNVFITQRTASNTQTTALSIDTSQNISIPNGNLAVTGNITVTGTVDGIDVAGLQAAKNSISTSNGAILNGVTATTQSAGDSSTKIATTAYTDTAIANLIDSSPSTLNTLNELASALGDDPNFATTVTNSIATKMPLAGGIFTGDVTFDGETAGRDIVFDRSDNALEFADNAQAKFGSNRLKIRFNGTESIIEDSSDLYILGDPIQLRRPNGDKYVQCIASNAVKLFFNGNEKFATTNTGVDVTGNIAVSGTVDGRDLATDGSKLDGIESGATADQSASEILTLIKTVDGAGSGLDADTLDGATSSFFQNASNLSSGTVPQARLSASTLLTLIKTVDGSGSGLDADNLDGRTWSTSASNSTIVSRNGNGYVFANYFNTTANDVSSGVTKVMVETGNDNYIRHGTAGAVRSFLNVEDGATADQSASEILTLIKTVDGAGSGLDADTVDGISSGSFLRSDANDTATGTLTVRDILFSSNYHLQRSNHHSGHLEGSYNNIGANDAKTNPIYSIGSSYNPNDASLNNFYGIGYTHTNASFINFTGASAWGLYVAADGDARVWLGGSNGVISSTGQHYVGSNVVWNAGNDGAGSGLDADTLDGVQGSNYLRSDTDDTFSANLTVDNGTSTTLSVKCDNAGLALIRANGDSQGTGAVEVGQANSYGGGIAYNGDGSPSFASGETSDHIMFYRLDNGTRTEVFHYPYNSNVVNFNSTPTVGGVSLVKTNDTIAQATNASTLDNIDSSSFVRSDAADTLSGTYTFSADSTDVINLSANSTGDNRGISFNGRTALSADYNDGYLRLNNAQEFSNGVYTPLVMRADGGFNVDGTMSINGSGNYVKALSTASDYSSLLRSDANDTATGEITFSGGAGAVQIPAASDIQFTASSGTWTGSVCKIQRYGSRLYIVGDSEGIRFREGGTDRWDINGDGHFVPRTDSTYNIGSNSIRVANGYFDTLYGDGSNLTGISAGATGGGSDEVFYENGQTVTTNYTITNGKNAMAAGPITINSGVTLTVGSGENLTIV